MDKNEKIITISQAKKQKNGPGHKKKIFLCAAVLLILICIVLFGVFQTKKMVVTGNDHYTEGEIAAALKQNTYVGNGLVLYLRNKLSPVKTLPFIKSVDISLQGTDQVTVHVNEKKRAGCLNYNGKYVYFDREGYALEIYEKHYEDVPLVTGLNYKEIALGEKIPEKKNSVFSQILKITMAIDKYGLPVSQIHFSADGKALLISGDLTVNLWNSQDLDLKLSELTGILPKMKGKKGTISMKFFTKDNPVAIFKTKK
ncbi:cell division protein FtsQ/DivIB [Anaerostipes sp.]|uniref:cell division protein FtsQ/DivIB n=1 Tax=Anaerostipes sp. TaxID=1872530 RepID=UPI0025B90603|nr:FtsQ-type POTRA domain-containing protein [Anaerostipes sp.]MBS7007913.1 FtsQ-type POTRA domain-containing protein [Anaerostipes sp.]